jgi:hypothetical protein
MPSDLLAYSLVGIGIVALASVVAYWLVKTSPKPSGPHPPEILATQSPATPKGPLTDEDIDRLARAVAAKLRPPETAAQSPAPTALPKGVTPAPPPIPPPHSETRHENELVPMSVKPLTATTPSPRATPPLQSPPTPSAAPQESVPSFPSASTPIVHPPSPGFAPGLPPSKRKHGPLYWIAVVFAVIVLIVLVVVIATIFTAVSSVVSSKVDVGGVNFDYGTNYCPAHEPASAPGFTSSGLATVKVTTTFVGPSGNGSCRLSIPYVEQIGFGITGSNLPLIVNQNQSAAGWFDILMPGTSYSGNLTISILVEVCGPNGENCV